VRAALPPRRITVAGLGNVLHGDDAFGPWVIEALAAGFVFPEGVSLADLGTPGLDLTPFVTGLDALVLIDTVLADAAPGTLRLYRRDELLRHAPQPRLSPHDPGVKEALLIAQFAGTAPRELLLVGAVPDSTAMGVGLSAALRAALPAAVAAVVTELLRLGAAPAARAAPRPPRPWWEQPAPAIDARP
jgi:hydrogenase maturation protease